jgi:hypothetical protein
MAASITRISCPIFLHKTLQNTPTYYQDAQQHQVCEKALLINFMVKRSITLIFLLKLSVILRNQGTLTEGEGSVQ